MGGSESGTDLPPSLFELQRTGGDPRQRGEGDPRQRGGSEPGTDLEIRASVGGTDLEIRASVGGTDLEIRASGVGGGESIDILQFLS